MIKLAIVVTGDMAHTQPDFKRGAEIQKVLDSCFESAKTNTWVNI